MRLLLIGALPLFLATAASGCDNLVPDGMATVGVEGFRFGDPGNASESGKVFYETVVLDSDPPLTAHAEFVTPYTRGGGMSRITLADGDVTTMGLETGMVVVLTYKMLGRDRTIVDYRLLLPEDRVAPPRNAGEEEALLSALSSEVAKGPEGWSLVAIPPQGNTARILVAYDEGRVQAGSPWTKWALIRKGAPEETYPSLKAAWKAGHR